MANILIAAHDETLRHLLGTSFRRFKHDVIMSVNGRHIVNLIRKDIFDLVVLDESIQDTTAIEILHQLDGYKSPDVKFMVMSSKSSPEIIKEYLQIGADDFIVKPLSLPKLVMRVESLLNQKTPAKEMVPEKIK